MSTLSFPKPPHAAECLTANVLADEEFVQKHLRTFIAFMGRDRYSEQMAREELPRLRATVGLNGGLLAALVRAGCRSRQGSPRGRADTPAGYGDAREAVPVDSQEQVIIPSPRSAPLQIESSSMLRGSLVERPFS